jgi:site-specific DNA recombinase
LIRAAIYARYSSALQHDVSIEDQIRSCRAWINKEGWILVTSYTDHAISGSIRLRPGYQKLLEGARSGEFDVVVSEALDRLSRDQEDVAALYKHLSFSGVKLITIGEGEISELHVGLKGTMKALFLKDLRVKVKCGLEGRVRQGRSGGGLSYGYDVVREYDSRGELIRGGRKSNEAEAAIVIASLRSSPPASRHAQSRRRLTLKKSLVLLVIRGARPRFTATGAAAPAFSTTSYISGDGSGIGSGS